MTVDSVNNFKSPKLSTNFIINVYYFIYINIYKSIKYMLINTINNFVINISTFNRY